MGTKCNSGEEEVKYFYGGRVYVKSAGGGQAFGVSVDSGGGSE